MGLRVLHSILFLVLLLMLFGSIHGRLYADVIKPNKIYVCKDKKWVRTLRLIPATRKTECQAIYFKDGVDRVVGSGRWTESCARFMDNVRDNLVKAGWSCKDVTESTTLSQSYPPDLQPLETEEGD